LNRGTVVKKPKEKRESTVEGEKRTKVVLVRGGSMSSVFLE